MMGLEDRRQNVWPHLQTVTSTSADQGLQAYRPSAIGSGSQHLPDVGGCPAAGGQTHTPPRVWIGELMGREVSGLTRGAGTAVTAGEVPQHKVVSGRHSDTRKRPVRRGNEQGSVLHVSKRWRGPGLDG